MKPAKILTARSTVITLLVVISTALLIASLLPQRDSSGGKPPEWVTGLPDSLKFLTSLAGLDNIVATGWFAALVALFSLSLIVSMFSQYATTKMQVDRMPSSAIPSESIRLQLSPETFTLRLAAAGYRRAGSGEGVQRYVKHRWGYWGNFLIHLGLVVVVLFSLVYILTQHRLMVRLTGDEITHLFPGNFVELKGVLPLHRQIPAGLALTRVEPRFWANDKLEYLSSELYVTERPGDQPRRVDVALCDKARYGGFIVYQMNAYGRAFDLQIITPDGETRQERLFLPYPLKRDSAGYGEIPIRDTDLLLKGKFYADEQRKAMTLNSSSLTLRLYRGKDLLGEATLQPGTAERLGPLQIKLVRSAWWSDIALNGSRGTYGIFTGFAIILAGVLSSYCLVPREIIVRESGGALFVNHVVRRFPLFYKEEFTDIINPEVGKEAS